VVISFEDQFFFAVFGPAAALHRSFLDEYLASFFFFCVVDLFLFSL